MHDRPHARDDGGRRVLCRPRRLRAGDVVRLVSPAGPADPDRVAAGVALLEGWGLRVEVAPAALGRAGLTSGTDAERLRDLQEALDDDRVRAVLATRGGYGTERIVDALDTARAVAGRKAVVGFSDLTALHLRLARDGLASFYGPPLAWSPERTGPRSAAMLRDALMGAQAPVLTADPAEPLFALRRPGRCSGVLLGGTLAMLASSAGTPTAPDLRGALLVLEDVAEAPYRIDRLLTQLGRSGALDGVAGVVVGQFTDCGDVADVLAERLGRLGVPVRGGFRIGHGTDQDTIALGVRAELDADRGRLTLLEPPTEPR